VVVLAVGEIDMKLKVMLVYYDLSKNLLHKILIQKTCCTYP
jgi:hypothetical protein